MKKTIILSAAALMVVAACSKQEASQPESKVISLQASMEQQVDPNASKTSLGAGNTVIWSDGDEILVYDNASTPNSVTLTADAGGATTAHFSGLGSLAETPSYAIFPAAKAESATSAGVITFTLPDTQKYAVDSFDPAGNVMVGEVSGGNVSFKNTCGILNLQLKGVMKVGKIELTTKGSEKLYGTFTANATAVEPSTSYVSGGGDTIILDCDDEGGVQLDAMTATNFYFVVPADAFATGFNATVYDVASYTDSKYSVNITAGTNTIVRRKIRRMPVVGVSLLPSGYTEVISLVHSAEQYVDTGIKFNTSGVISIIEGQSKCAYYPAANQYYTVCATQTGTGENVPRWGGVQYTFLTEDKVVFVDGYKMAGHTSAVFSASTSVIDCWSRATNISTGTTTVSCNGITLTDGDSVQVNASTCNTNISLKLGCKDNNGALSEFFVGSIYRFRVSVDGVVQALYIPARNNSDVLGWYDVVSEAFLPNQGSAPYTSGGNLDVVKSFQK